MTCQEFDHLIVNLTCDLPLPEPERKRALAHADTCLQCGARLARQQSVRGALQSLAQREHTINAPDHIRQRMMAAFEQQQAATTTTPVRTPFWARWRWQWAMPIAATALMVCALLAGWWHVWQPVQEAERTEAPAAKPASPPQETMSEQRPATRSQSEPVAMARATARTIIKPRETRVIKAVRPEPEFISLRPGTQAEPSEFEQVVRMEIPRTTLALWGVRINDESDSQKVNAEVVFGEDGVACAIRILN